MTGPWDGFLHKEFETVHYLCLINISWESSRGQALSTETHPHLGVDLRLHHGPHHRRPASSGVFHFHFKCLTALIQKLGRDRVVRVQVELINEAKITIYTLSTTQQDRDNTSKPINLAKLWLSWTSTLSHFKKVGAEKPLASTGGFHVQHQEEKWKCNSTP